MYLGHFLKQLFPEDLDLHFDCFEHGKDRLSLTLKNVRSSACRPVCGGCSARIHSRYTRHVTDLPWAGLPVKLVLAVRRFRCGSLVCSRRIFAEYFPSFVEPYARLSTHLRNVLKHVVNVGGEPGKRLLKVVGVFVSGDKLLSLARDAKPPAAVSHRIIGVDDFAFKRGERYGTVIVDLETRKPVDLLPDRSARTLATWLGSRTDIEIVCRDRSTEFERGIALGAPDATQVLDRWHVLKNLREACERQLKRYQSAMDEVAGAMKAEPYRLLRSPREEADRALAQQKRRRRIQQIRDLHEQGLGKSAIARQLRVSLTFVRRSINLDALPMAGNSWLVSDLER